MTSTPSATATADAVEDVASNGTIVSKAPGSAAGDLAVRPIRTVLAGPNEIYVAAAVVAGESEAHSVNDGRFGGMKLDVGV